MDIEAQRELRWWDTQGLLRGLEWVVGEHETTAGDKTHTPFRADGSGESEMPASWD